jgi:GntR family transcriptional repressor for pyruvate dehydrogenase complex
LLERIHSGGFKPGEKLPTERELCELFGVSRGVVREAIRVLVTLGMVESRQGAGTFVLTDLVPPVSRAMFFTARPPENATLFSMMEFRAAVEGQAAELAALRRTDEEADEIMAAADATHVEPNQWIAHGVVDGEFHLRVSMACRNPYFVAVLKASREILQYTASMIGAEVGSIAVSAEQHRAIALAIKARDAAEAGRAMRSHVQYATESIQDAIEFPKRQATPIEFIPGFKPIPPGRDL